MTITMKNTVFLNMIWCSPSWDELSGAIYMVYKMEATGFSPLLVNLYKTTQHHSPEDSILQICVGTSYDFNRNQSLWVPLLAGLI